MWRLKNLEVVSPALMLSVIAADVQQQFGLDVITSAHRPGDLGVHGTYPETRGLDLRCRNAAQGKVVCDYINSRYQYDPDRPDKMCAIFHKVGNGAYHLHLQSHPNTIRRKVC